MVAGGVLRGDRHQRATVQLGARTQFAHDLDRGHLAGTDEVVVQFEEEFLADLEQLLAGFLRSGTGHGLQVALANLGAALLDEERFERVDAATLVVELLAEDDAGVVGERVPFVTDHRSADDALALLGPGRHLDACHDGGDDGRTTRFAFRAGCLAGGLFGFACLATLFREFLVDERLQDGLRLGEPDAHPHVGGDFDLDCEALLDGASASPDGAAVGDGLGHLGQVGDDEDVLHLLLDDVHLGDDEFGVAVAIDIDFAQMCTLGVGITDELPVDDRGVGFVHHPLGQELGELLVAQVARHDRVHEEVAEAQDLLVEGVFAFILGSGNDFDLLLGHDGPPM